MAREKKLTPAPVAKVEVYGTKGGVLVVGASAAQVRKAMRSSVINNDARERVATALKLYGVLQRFFRSGGRFKKRYHRKPRLVKK